MALYAWTVLLGSFLLFEVQPIAGKYLLPMFGGSPSVWTVCLLFFQAFLLGGYAYAHVLTRYAGPRLQAGVHALLLLMSVACLPVTIRLDRVADLGGRPVLQVLAILAVSIGVPVLALSATSPLMQAWATLGVAPKAPIKTGAE